VSAHSRRPADSLLLFLSTVGWADYALIAIGLSMLYIFFEMMKLMWPSKEHE
jgi:hypothetical protein